MYIRIQLLPEHNAYSTKKREYNMRIKTWCIIFISLILLCLLFITGVNIFVDPVGYFRSQSGEWVYQNDNSYYMRELKAEYILHHPEEYDAFVIGGSKAGSLRSKKLMEMDGHKYFNTWVLSGNFQDYYYNTKFVIEHAHPKKILFHISTSEFRLYEREQLGSIYELPAIISGESKSKETLGFLFQNLSVSWDEINADKSERPISFPTGEYNLSRYYKAFKKDPDNYYRKYMEKDTVKYGNRLLTGKAQSKASVIDKCLDDLQKIKDLCDINKIELQVVMAPLFIAEIARYENKHIYSAILRIAEITGGFWCFSHITDYSLNPANFYNAFHYYYEMGDIMIDTMSGKPDEYNFGVYVTPENAADYIKDRKERFEEIKEYYRKNKKLPLLPYEHESTINRERKENINIPELFDLPE